MINYIIQVVLFQTLFLVVYDFFLQKETFFNWNRAYLILTPLLSFFIPLVKFESIQSSIPTEYFVQLPEVVLNPQIVIEKNFYNQQHFNYPEFIFWSGVLVFSLLFIFKMAKLIKLIRSNPILKKSNYHLVLLNKKQTAFSFFNYIFIHKKLIENKDLEIIKHEMVHCKQKHTVDLLMFELLKIALWFNPFIYVYQKRITVLHEYISDAEVVKEIDKNQYFNTLLSETFNVENISFVNQFYKQSFIKKRIAMITKNKSEKINQLKYLLIIPILIAMLMYISCTNDTLTSIEEIESNLMEVKDFNNGKYFETKQGKIFIGNSILVNRYLDFEEYNDFEKKIHNKFNSEDSMFDFVVLINYNEERIGFFRPKSLRQESENEWKYTEGEPVPYAKIEEMPLYPGCEGTQEELKHCLQENITMYINKNFNSGLANSLRLSPGIKRIFVMFEINENGNVVEIKARAPHQSLADEAIRVVNSLPKMEPGKYLGKNVSVKYSLPIAFNVE